MAIEPASRLAEEPHELRTLVARCPLVQARFGEDGNPVRTAKRIVLDAKVTITAYTGPFGGNVSIDAEGMTRPYGVVMRPPSPMWTQYAGGEQNWLVRSGAIWLYLTDRSRYPTERDDDFTDFANFAGGVDEWLAGQAGRDTNLPTINIDLVFGPRRNGPVAAATQGAWWEVLYMVTWN